MDDISLLLKLLSHEHRTSTYSKIRREKENKTLNYISKMLLVQLENCNMVVVMRELSLFTVEAPAAEVVHQLQHNEIKVFFSVLIFSLQH